ncbi:MAG: TIGR00366 family protein [Planctomycetota bacterium]
MIAAIGSRISRVFERTAPDPFVLAILLTAVTAAAALLFGDFASKPADESRAGYLLTQWRSDSGLWALIGFGMQMCLVLVTGHALAEARPIKRALHSIAAIPRDARTATAMVAFVACVTGLLNWGLALVVGATLAREVARSLEARGVRAHYPLLAAAGYAGLLVWHGGLSGSAPITMTTEAGAARVLNDPGLLERIGGPVPLGETLASPMNLVVSGGLALLVPLVFALLVPRDGAGELRPVTDYRPLESEPETRPENGTRPASIPEHLARSRVLAWGLAAAFGLAFFSSAAGKSLGSIGLNDVNALMLMLGLALHASSASYARAAEDGARGCAGIILQFPLYAGIAAMLKTSGLVAMFARGAAELPSWALEPGMFFLSGVVNFFVPSGGGQWGIQGPIALEAAAAAGTDPGRMIMAVAYGDQLTNMLQPFWALPLLAITGVKAREIVGYTAVVMLAAAAWMLLGLAVM